MSKVLIVGGNAGGMTAAGRAARVNPDLDITVLEHGPYVSYSICGAPYFLSGEVSRVRDLVSYTPQEFQKRRGVRVLTRTLVESVEPARKRVVAREMERGKEVMFSFDRLLLSTGYKPLKPVFPGSDLRNVFTLASLTDAEAIRQALAGKPKHALLIGGGLVNMELAEAMRKQGIGVTLLEKSGQILRGLDPEIADLAEKELVRNEVPVWKGKTVRTVFGNPEGRVESAWLEGSSERVPADLVLVDIGVRPEVGLAERAGIQLGRSGAIAVTPQMETSAAGIYAAGNCAEAVDLVSNQPVFSPLGTVANKQGRIAGENLAGRHSVFHGVLNTWVVKIFDLCVARTGLSEWEAAACGFKPLSVQITAPDRAGYYPNARDVTIRAIADRASRKLLGLQAAGEGAEKRVDVAAVALSNGMKVEDAAQLDLSYAPPYSQVWDPFLIAMNALLRHL